MQPPCRLMVLGCFRVLLVPKCRALTSLTLSHSRGSPKVWKVTLSDATADWQRGQWVGPKNCSQEIDRCQGASLLALLCPPSWNSAPCVAASLGLHLSCPPARGLSWNCVAKPPSSRVGGIDCTLWPSGHSGRGANQQDMAQDGSWEPGARVCSLPLSLVTPLMFLFSFPISPLWWPGGGPRSPLPE